MRKANPLWGAPRIHGELLKLGIEISQATVGRWMPWRPKVLSLLKISTGLRETGDFHETTVPLRSWWRFSLPLH